jgi:hypothetical protein
MSKPHVVSNDEHGDMVGFEVLTAVTMKTLSSGTPRAAWFLLATCLAYSSIPKMEAACSSETSVNFYYRTTWRYLPEDCIPHRHIALR